MTGLRVGWMVLVAVAATSLSSRLAAQDRLAPPNVRVDLLASAGVGGFAVPTTGYTRFIGIGALELRFAARSGDGALVRVANGSDVWGQGTGVDIDYLRRVRLQGDDRQGIGVDLAGGLTFASLSHNESTLPLGLHVGANLGASLDFRISFFTFTVGAEYRYLIPTEDAIDGSRAGPEHVLTATLGIGFGYWA